MPRPERRDVPFCEGRIPWLGSGTMTQITMDYKHDGGAIATLRVQLRFAFQTVVLSCQHGETTTTEDLCKEIKEKIVKITPAIYLDETTLYDLKLGTGTKQSCITGQLHQHCQFFLKIELNFVD